MQIFFYSESSKLSRKPCLPVAQVPLFSMTDYLEHFQCQICPHHVLSINFADAMLILHFIYIFTGIHFPQKWYPKHGWALLYSSWGTSSKWV